MAHVRPRSAARACRARRRSAPSSRRRSPARSTSSEQRRRRFFGLAGSQAPQPCPTRGTPAEEAQPRMVAAKAQARAPVRRRCGKRGAACWRAPPPPAPRAPFPAPRRRRARSRRRRPARCACRDAGRGRDRARRSRPESGRAERRGRWRAVRPTFLKVTTPEKEIERPRSSAVSASARDEVKQWRSAAERPPAPSPPSGSRRCRPRRRGYG